MNALITLSVFGILSLFLGLNKTTSKWLMPATLTGLLAALGLAGAEWNANSDPIYGGMMLFDNYAVAFSAVTIVSTGLVFMLSKGYFERISTHVAEYHSLILFALSGIIVMVSYHNLVMLFIGIEIMSVSLYILAGIRKADFASNEAALKYFLMGAFSTGFFLFGIALIYGVAHSFDLSAIHTLLENAMDNRQTISPLLLVGIVMIMIGLAFKVGAAPFHFWTPDVYEGAPSLISLFMITAVKVAGFAAFLRLFQACFAPVIHFWVPAMIGITGISLLVGNVSALYQQNVKRMLAWSSVSHAGYILFAIVSLSESSASGILLYAIAYSAASIIAFGGLILVKKQFGSDSYDSFNGLAAKNPFLAFAITVSMFSLAGIPLTAGFVGKFMMFSGALASYHTYLVVFAVINAVIGIAYYFRVIMAMYFKPGESGVIKIQPMFALALIIALVFTLIVGIWPGFVPNLI